MGRAGAGGGGGGMQFDINKYKEIMKHIDEEEEDDMEIVSFTDKDILDKVK